jgi:hypothetical protein
MLQHVTRAQALASCVQPPTAAVRKRYSPPPLAPHAVAAMPPALFFDAVAEHDALATLFAEAAAWRDDPDAPLHASVPDVSSWSPAQHLHHVAQINAGVLAWVAGVAVPAGSAADAPEADGTPTATGRMLLAAGRIPRGQGQSPAALVPPDDVPAERLAARLTEQQARLDALAPHLDALGALTARRKHPVFGLLNATQWLRFCRVHTDHHHRIIRDILAAHA